jgi:heat shock protein HslJ
VPVTIADPSRSTLQFLPDGRLLARLDCHHGHGRYTAAAGVLALTPLAVTTAMCPPDSEDTRIQTILERATSYAFDPDGLLLLHGDNGSLHLRPALTGVRWAWQTFQGGDGTIVRPDDSSQYTVEFLPDGTLAIEAACDHAVGTYTVSNSTVDLRIGERTPAICPPGVLMDRFLRDLDQVTSHVFRDGKLYLALPMDAGIHAFAPTSVAPPAATPATG